MSGRHTAYEVSQRIDAVLADEDADEHAAAEQLPDWLDTPPLQIKHLDGETFVMYSPAKSIRSSLWSGRALVPQSAITLHVAHIVLCPTAVTPARPVELHMVWRRHDEIPVLPRFLTIVRNLAAREKRR